jgi:hypothetical protein
METNRRVCRSILVVGLFALVAVPAAGQATRTWVSGVGDDANPCSRTAPCKTFAGAISKTAASGEINVLDPGGFGGVTITKSITISAEGVEAGVLVSGTNAIIVNAGASDIVVLRGLDIEGLNTGLNGVRFLAGGALYVENCTINGFNGASAGVGISFEPAGTSQLFVSDTVVRNSRLSANGGGLLIKPVGSGFANVVLERVRLERNVFGLRVTNAATISISDSVIAGNAFNGMTVLSAGTPVNVFVDGTSIVGNGGTGISVSGAVATVRIGGSTVTGNATGLAPGSGQILSYQTNHIDGNTTDGAPNGTLNPG